MRDNYKSFMMLLRLINKSDHMYIPILILNSMLNSINTIINIFIPKIFIDGFLKNTSMERFIRDLVIILIIKFVVKILDKLLERENLVRRDTINYKLPYELSKKAMDLDYYKIEDSKILDLKERALFPITSFGAIYGLFDAFKTIITSLTTIIATAIIIFNFSYILVAVSLLLSIVIILLDRRLSRYSQGFIEELIPINRKYGYYLSLTNRADYQKEIRIFDMNKLLINKAETYINEALDNMHDLHIKQANTESIQIIIQTIIKFITYSYVALRTMSDSYGAQIGFGEFSVVITANENFISSIQKIFIDIERFNMQLKYLEPFYEFMMIDYDDDNNGNKIPDTFKSLEFKNVSFTYPGSNREILSDISFRIEKGEKISIVGVNNAGKTTIVKLIARFFYPTKGEILYNDININLYDKNEYYNKISAVFQDFAMMPFSIKENIISNDKYDENKMKDILEEVGLYDKISKLENNIDTKFNREIYEDATDFSGGEKQKIAIARALYRNGDLVILDEPTASLDPLAEAAVYENFNKMTENKTSIFISHRMSSSRFSDKILLLENGKIIAFDSHDNLMKTDNLYRKLYNSQASYFK